MALRVDEKIRRLAALPRPEGNFLSLTSLARLFEISVPSARVVAKRYERKAVLRRVGPELWANLLGDPSREQLAGLLHPPGYLSCEFALLRSGAITQIPRELIVVTTGRPRRVSTPWGPLRYQHVAPERFFGFDVQRLETGAQTWVAEPEKALVDWVYLGGRAGEGPALDEVDFRRLDRKKLRRYAAAFPPQVARLLKGAATPSPSGPSSARAPRPRARRRRTRSSSAAAGSAPPPRTPRRPGSPSR